MSISLDWRHVASFISLCFDYLQDIKIVANGYYITLFDIIIFSAITGGLATLTYIFLSGGYTNGYE